MSRLRSAEPVGRRARRLAAPLTRVRVYGTYRMIVIRSVAGGASGADAEECAAR